MPTVSLNCAKAFFCDQPIDELLGSVGADREVPFYQIDVDARKNLGYEANVFIGRWRMLLLPSPHRRLTSTA